MSMALYGVQSPFTSTSVILVFCRSASDDLYHGNKETKPHKGKPLAGVTQNPHLSPVPLCSLAPETLQLPASEGGVLAQGGGPRATLRINTQMRCCSSGPSKLSHELASEDKLAGSLGQRRGEAEPENLRHRS